MSIIGILSSNLFASGASQHTQNAQNTQSSGNGPSKFQQIKTEFQQLGQDLQAGNLQAAQSDYANVQQDAQQNASQNAAQAHGHHHHHHHTEGSQESGANQGTSAVQQAFTQLAQSLQAGSLSGAQSAFATLQNDLQQIGGFLPGFSSTGSGSSGGGPIPAASGNLSVSA
jgi:hypothetical protein